MNRLIHTPIKNSVQYLSTAIDGYPVKEKVEGIAKTIIPVLTPSTDD